MDRGLLQRLTALVLAGGEPELERFDVATVDLSERDHRLYGLGSTDMKGFFPIAMAAARSFADKNLKQPLIILATADEESSMQGARQIAQAGRPLGRAAIIGEPTSLVPVRMHKGIMMTLHAGDKVLLYLLDLLSALTQLTIAFLATFGKDDSECHVKPTTA